MAAVLGQGGCASNPLLSGSVYKGETPEGYRRLQRVAAKSLRTHNWPTLGRKRVRKGQLAQAPRLPQRMAAAAAERLRTRQRGVFPYSSAEKNK